MFEMLQVRLIPIFSAENARRMRRPGLQACLIVLTGLAIQLALGMILNLYIATSGIMLLRAIAPRARDATAGIAGP
jgi:hypothetical protein